MKVSIIPADGKVAVEGEAHEVDMNDMPEYVHAVQWDGRQGEVEFKPDRTGRKLPNLRFTIFEPFDFMVDRWQQRKRVDDLKKKQREDDLAAAKREQYERDEGKRNERPM